MVPISLCLSILVLPICACLLKEGDEKLSQFGRVFLLSAAVFWLPPFHFISPVFIMNILPSPVSLFPPFGIISDDKRRKLIRIHSGATMRARDSDCQIRADPLSTKAVGSSGRGEGKKR